MPSTPPASRDSDEISLRDETPGDEPFLAEVYASTRDDELKFVNWDAATRAAFLDLQFQAMLRGYRSRFPQAQFSIICRAGRPVGRIVVQRAAGEWRVVDVALLPAERNRGIGSRLLLGLLAEAGALGQPVRLRVLPSNPARRLYARLGFRTIERGEVYDHLEWRPAAPSAADSV